MTVNAEITDGAGFIKQDLEEIVGWLEFVATYIDTGIPLAVTPGEDLHPHMWERLDMLPEYVKNINRDCRELAWDLDHYLNLIGVEPTEWQASVLEDLENLVKDSQPAKGADQ